MSTITGGSPRVGVRAALPSKDSHVATSVDPGSGHTIGSSPRFLADLRQARSRRDVLAERGPRYTPSCARFLTHRAMHVKTQDQ